MQTLKNEKVYRKLKASILFTWNCLPCELGCHVNEATSPTVASQYDANAMALVLQSHQVEGLCRCACGTQYSRGVGPCIVLQVAAFQQRV